MNKLKNILINEKLKIILIILIIIIGIIIAYSRFLYPKIIQKYFFVNDTFVTLEQYDRGISELNKGLFFNPFDSEIYYRKANNYVALNMKPKKF